VRRETASAYLKAAGIAVRDPRHRLLASSKPASGVSTDPAALPSGITGPLTWPAVGRAPAASACAPYRELIEVGLTRGRDTMAIWRDLVGDHGFPARYASVRRFVVKLQGERTADAHPVIVTPPGEEAQVDYGTGPMVRHPVTGKYRRTRLFVLTLGYSRKSVRLLLFASSTRSWAELHEHAFRRLGGVVRVVVLDNLREGALCDALHRREGERGVRRLLGVLALVNTHGAVVVDQACAAAQELGVSDYRFVRRYLDRHPAAPLTLRQVDPLIRELTYYRDVIARKTQEAPS
jgi:transposase